MVDVYYIESMAQVQAMAEPTRWHMLGLMALGPMTGSQLARALSIPRTRAHYHLNILREAGLVEFQHEQLNGGIVEKYYRAVARQLRTDHLVDRTRVAAKESGEDAGTGEIIRDIILNMLAVLRANLLLPNVLPGLAQAGYNWQDELLLTAEQSDGLIRDLREVTNRFVELDRQNRAASSDAGEAGALQPLMLTTLLTPVVNLQFDSKPKARGEPRRREERLVHDAERPD